MFILKVVVAIIIIGLIGMVFGDTADSKGSKSKKDDDLFDFDNNYYTHFYDDPDDK